MENFAVQLQTPGNEAAIRPGSATQATILIDDAGTSKSSYYVISRIYFSALQQTEKQIQVFFSPACLSYACTQIDFFIINDQCKNHQNDTKRSQNKKYRKCIVSQAAED